MRTFALVVVGTLVGHALWTWADDIAAALWFTPSEEGWFLTLMFWAGVGCIGFGVIVAVANVLARKLHSDGADQGGVAPKGSSEGSGVVR